MKAIAVQTWAGLLHYSVEIVGETPKRLRVKLLQDAMLPGKRFVTAGSIILVPRHAVVDKN